MERIEVLTDESHLGSVSGALLDQSLDAELQAIVEKAARELSVPIALVTLVLKHVQFFRAHVGLPPALALARATDRCVSFCQFVVRDRAPFEINDALRDERVPTELAQRYGLMAYLGMPLRVGGDVVGSLCVVDNVPRQFSPAERAALSALAEVASARVTRLAGSKSTPAALVEQAAAPAFQELRNALAHLTANVAVGRIAVVELQPRIRLVEEIARTSSSVHQTAFTALVEAPRALADLEVVLADLETAAGQIRSGILALEKLSLPEHRRTHVGEVLSAALELSKHFTKLVGGLAPPAIPSRAELKGARAPLIAALAALFAAVGSRTNERQLTGLALSVQKDERSVQVILGSPLGAADSLAIVTELGPLMAEVGLELAATGGAFALALPAAARRG